MTNTLFLEDKLGQFENVKFTVLNVEERRIGKVKVEILPIEEKHTFGWIYGVSSWIFTNDVYW